MTADEFIDMAVSIGLMLLVLIPVALLSGHMISHHVKRNLDRFREMTPRRSFFFGIYCTLCVAVSYGVVSMPIFVLLAFM